MDYLKINCNNKKYNDTHFFNTLIDFSPLYFLSIWRDIPINQLSTHVPPKLISELSKKFRYLVEITKFPYQCVLSCTYYLYMLSKKHPELKGYGSEKNLMVMALMVTNKMVGLLIYIKSFFFLIVILIKSFFYFIIFNNSYMITLTQIKPGQKLVIFL